MSDSMPVLFISHGAPDVLLQKDPVIDEWRGQARSLPYPRRILVISAHWETTGFMIGGNRAGKTIHDFYGFPDALYDYRYAPPEDVHWADALADRLGIGTDHDRGLDHGAWVPLHALYPGADIPVTQLSVARGGSPGEHYELGRRLAGLREEGVLILASGVIVHNLSALDWRQPLADPEPWAVRFMEGVDEALHSENLELLFEPRRMPGASRALPSLEHFLPLLVAFGAAGIGARVEMFARTWRYRNLSQHSYRFK